MGRLFVRLDFLDRCVGCCNVCAAFSWQCTLAIPKRHRVIVSFTFIRGYGKFSSDVSAGVLLLHFITYAGAISALRRSSESDFSLFTRPDGPFAPISSPILVVQFNNDVPDIAGKNVTGRIVFCAGRSLARFWVWVVNTAPGLGITAMMVTDGDEDAVGSLTTVPKGGPLPFPVVGVGRLSTEVIVRTLQASENATVVATVDQVSVPNYFYLVLNSGAFWFFRVFLPIAQGGLVILGVGRLVQFYLSLGKIELHVVNLVLLFETIGAALRFVYWAVSPHGSFPVVWTDEARDVWHTISIPFSVNATLLLTIFWHETVRCSISILGVRLSRFAHTGFYFSRLTQHPLNFHFPSSDGRFPPIFSQGSFLRWK